MLKLNKFTNDSFIFVEGFATAMRLLQIVYRSETDITVIVCFNYDNLKVVISHFYNLYPEAELCIWADNDLNGVGLKKAKEVAMIISTKQYLNNFYLLLLNIIATSIRIITIMNM